MAQSPTAFDAVEPDWSLDSRFIIAAFGAVILGTVTALLAQKANNQQT